jgi:hypothetical protein
MYWFGVQSLICMFEMLELSGWKVCRAGPAGRSLGVDFYATHPDGRGLSKTELSRVNKLLDNLRTFCPMGVDIWRHSEDCENYAALCEAYDQYILDYSRCYEEGR